MKEQKSDQHLWNFAFSVLFALLLVLAIIDIGEMGGYVPHEVPLFDALLISLAIFRIIRLFSYDKITQWFRDLFLETRQEKGSDGLIYIERRPYARGPLRAMSDLLACPWCTGVWAALFVVYLYFAFPWFWIPIFMLAVAGVGSFLQILANLIGWRAENAKREGEERSGHES